MLDLPLASPCYVLAAGPHLSQTHGLPHVVHCCLGSRRPGAVGPHRSSDIALVPLAALKAACGLLAGPAGGVGCRTAARRTTEGRC